VHCIPGITAAAGICAELGIPMTHRGIATSVRFLTGHSREGGEACLDASTAAAASDTHTTLVVYMGLQNLPRIAQQLAAAGWPSDLPAVAVERGTTSQQRVVYGRLSDLHDRASEVRLESPTLIVVGQVVGLCPGFQAWVGQGEPVVAVGAEVDACWAAQDGWGGVAGFVAQKQLQLQVGMGGQVHAHASGGWGLE
jgi:uroporphyrin-III C-methyltransferase